MTMYGHLGHQQNSSAMDIVNINNEAHGHNLTSDHDDGSSDFSCEGSTHDTDSECATDFESNSLGQCGLSACEYGPSVDVYGVNVPGNMFVCTKKDCGWIVCRECRRKGGHKRHKKYMSLVE